MSWFDGRGRAAREGRRKPVKPKGIYSGVSTSGTVRADGPGSSRTVQVKKSSSYSGVKSTGRAPIRDRSLTPNATTGLSRAKELEANLALKSDAGTGHLAEALTNITLTAAPVGVAARATTLLPRVIRAARIAQESGDSVQFARLATVAEKVAERSQKASKAARATQRTKVPKRGRKTREFALDNAHFLAERYGQVPARGLRDGANKVARVTHKEDSLRKAWRGAALTPAFSSVAAPKGLEIADWYRDKGALMYRLLTDPEFAERIKQAGNRRSDAENRATLLDQFDRYGD